MEPTPYVDYEGLIFGQMEKILKKDSTPYRIESEKESDRPLGLEF